MTNSRFALLGSGLLLLAACSAPKSADLQTLLQNPLYAEQYYDAQVDNMVNVLIGSGDLLKDPSVKEAVDDARVEGLRLAQEATLRQREGKMGFLLSDTEEVAGEVVVLDTMLYTGPEFQMFPGVDVRVYLSTVLDPRDAAFPDETAVEVGSIHTVFGAAGYEVPLSADQLETMQTVVFFDKALKRIVGFAQLQGQN